MTSPDIWNCKSCDKQSPRVSVNAAPPESRAFANVANSPGLRRLRFPFFKPHCQRAGAVTDGAASTPSNGSKCFYRSQTQVERNPGRTPRTAPLRLSKVARRHKTTSGKTSCPRRSRYLRLRGSLVKASLRAFQTYHNSAGNGPLTSFATSDFAVTLLPDCAAILALKNRATNSRPLWLMRFKRGSLFETSMSSADRRQGSMEPVPQVADPTRKSTSSGRRKRVIEPGI